MDTQKNFTECFRCSFEGPYSERIKIIIDFSDIPSLSRKALKHNQMV